MCNLFISKAKRAKAIVVVLGLFACSPGVAQQNDDKQAKKTVINQSQAIQNARQRVDGRVLRVDRNNQHYRIKMLQKSGRVVSVDVNRNTGRVVQHAAQAPAKKDK